ncbi:MAG TPA: DUF447 domain-containing protein [Pirellulales bacterium]|nr:DUF447 domain-containing protein [Pirellulales bacterium]
MILEGIMTTLGPEGSLNVAPMGPKVDAGMTRLLLRPFQTSTTYANLRRTGQGVFHVTDDVELLAAAAIGTLEHDPPTIAATAIEGRILTGCCRWYALRVREIDDRQPRTEIVAEVVDQGFRREFFGFNRAKHAVLEAAILATRVHLLSADHLHAELSRLRPLVQKTGGPPEERAFAMVERHIDARLGEDATGSSDA